MKGLRLKGKKAAAFGCYYWSGESVKVLNELMATPVLKLLKAIETVEPDSDAQKV